MQGVEESTVVYESWEHGEFRRRVLHGVPEFRDDGLLIIHRRAGDFVIASKLVLQIIPPRPAARRNPGADG